MKKLIIICFLAFFPVPGNAQVNKKTNLNELNQDQLNLELTKSLKKIEAAKIWTGVGVGLGIIGGILVITGENKQNKSEGWLSGLPNGEMATGYPLMIGGIITTVTAIVTGKKASNRKTDIELELVKFYPPGSATINGVGLKIRF